MKNVKQINAKLKAYEMISRNPYYRFGTKETAVAINKFLREII